MTAVATTPDTRLSPAERRALALAASATVGFGAYGAATGAPSTAAYLVAVSALAATLLSLRRRPLPSPLAYGLAALAAAHLAGGLVGVGDGVLYNASYRTAVLQYDHLVHSSAVFVGTLTVWTVLSGRRGGGATVAVWVLAGLGLGALNEMVEFLATLAHGGSAVGGYRNTGWDLVSNVVGAGAAGAVLARRGRAAGDGSR
ncbi:MAG TPA: hypothetical protein VM263_07785 [Acidimicrobiales bacterium]|nr:hypothetical protein [Acidimicrobiales bacterium]